MMMTLFIIGRVLFGGFFVLSGYKHFKNLAGMAGYAQSKGIPSPKLMVVLSGIMLLLGGLGVVFFVYVKIALLLLALFLIPTTFMMHQFWKATDPMRKMNESIGFQKNLALLGAIIMLFLVL
ncbi:MAG: DoxX family membrane protein [bacterium]